jgi:Flp pilus assembly pilin Flp
MREHKRKRYSEDYSLAAKVKFPWQTVLDKPTAARKVLVSLRAKSCHTDLRNTRIGAKEGATVTYAIHALWTDEKGQDIAEYAVMLAVILVLVIGTIRLVGTNSNTVFSRVASSIQ